VSVSLERVAGVPVEIGALQRSSRGIGRGSAALLDATLAAAPARPPVLAAEWRPAPRVSASAGRQAA
jgi:hypothetical protein